MGIGKFIRRDNEVLKTEKSYTLDFKYNESKGRFEILIDPFPEKDVLHLMYAMGIYPKPNSESFFAHYNLSVFLKELKESLAVGKFPTTISYKPSVEPVASNFGRKKHAVVDAQYLDQDGSIDTYTYVVFANTEKELIGLSEITPKLIFGDRYISAKHTIHIRTREARRLYTDGHVLTGFPPPYAIWTESDFEVQKISANEVGQDNSSAEGPADLANLSDNQAEAESAEGVEQENSPAEAVQQISSDGDQAPEQNGILRDIRDVASSTGDHPQKLAESSKSIDKKEHSLIHPKEIRIIPGKKDNPEEPDYSIGIHFRTWAAANTYAVLLDQIDAPYFYFVEWNDGRLIEGRLHIDSTKVNRADSHALLSEFLFGLYMDHANYEEYTLAQVTGDPAEAMQLVLGYNFYDSQDDVAPVGLPKKVNGKYPIHEVEVAPTREENNSTPDWKNSENAKSWKEANEKIRLLSERSHQFFYRIKWIDGMEIEGWFDRRSLDQADQSDTFLSDWAFRFRSKVSKSEPQLGQLTQPQIEFSKLLVRNYHFYDPETIEETEEPSVELPKKNTPIPLDVEDWDPKYPGPLNKTSVLTEFVKWAKENELFDQDTQNLQATFFDWMDEFAPELDAKKLEIFNDFDKWHNPKIHKRDKVILQQLSTIVPGFMDHILQGVPEGVSSDETFSYRFSHVGPKGEIVIHLEENDSGTVQPGTIMSARIWPELQIVEALSIKYMDTLREVYRYDDNGRELIDWKEKALINRILIDWLFYLKKAGVRIHLKGIEPNDAMLRQVNLAVGFRMIDRTEENELAEENFTRINQLVPAVLEQISKGKQTGKSSSGDIVFQHLDNDKRGDIIITLTEFSNSGSGPNANPEFEIQILEASKQAFVLSRRTPLAQRYAYEFDSNGNVITTNGGERIFLNQALADWLRSKLNADELIDLRSEEPVEDPSGKSGQLWGDDEFEAIERNFLEAVKANRPYLLESKLRKLRSQLVSGKFIPQLPRIITMLSSRGVTKSVLKKAGFDLYSIIHETSFLKHLERNIWDLFPDKLKEIKRLAPRKWEPIKSSRGLQLITSHFLNSTYDSLRPFNGSVSFDDKGTVATDALRFLFLNVVNPEERGTFCMTKSCWDEMQRVAKADGQTVDELLDKNWTKVETKYPRYDTIIRNDHAFTITAELHPIRVFAEVMLKLKLGSKTPQHGSKEFIWLKADRRLLAFNAKHLSQVLKGLQLLGNSKMDLGFGDSSTKDAMYFAEVNQLDKVKTLQVPFAMLMPMYVSEGPSHGDLVYDLRSQQVFTEGISLDRTGATNASLTVTPAKLLNKDQKIQVIVEFSKWLKEQGKEAPEDYDKQKVLFSEYIYQERPELKNQIKSIWTRYLKMIKNLRGESLPVSQPYSGNYNKLNKIIPNIVDEIKKGKRHGKSEDGDISFNYLRQDDKGRLIISLSHYYELHGDLIADPDMEIRIFPHLKMVEAMNLTNAGRFFRVYHYDEDGKEHGIDLKEKKSQNQFLSKWLRDLVSRNQVIDLSSSEVDPDQLEEFQRDQEPSSENYLQQLESAYWRPVYQKNAPQELFEYNGQKFHGHFLRRSLLDVLGELSPMEQLEVLTKLREEFGLEPKLEEYTKRFGKHYENETVLREYVSDIIKEMDLQADQPAGVMQWLINHIVDQDNVLVDLPAQPTKHPSVDPIPEQEAIHTKTQNQHELNQAIEAFIDRKDNTGENYSNEDLRYISQYEGSGGLGSKGARGKGILYEFYTTAELVQLMWHIAELTGNTSGKILDPAVGTGRLLAYAPKEANIVGFETNHYAARIAQLLYPASKIIEKPFESIFYDGNQYLGGKSKFNFSPFDLVIGNPPMGKFSGHYAGLGEKDYTDAKEYDHYFLTRGLDLLRPGGVIVMLMGYGFMQSATRNSRVKKRIHKKARFLTALACPEKVFPNTDYQTEIVAFQRR